jgi:hypothetical protein
LYGHAPARDFGPLALKAVRERLLDMPRGHCRPVFSAHLSICEGESAL